MRKQIMTRGQSLLTMMRYRTEPWSPSETPSYACRDHIDWLIRKGLKRTYFHGIFNGGVGGRLYHFFSLIFQNSLEGSYSSVKMNPSLTKFITLFSHWQIIVELTPLRALNIPHPKTIQSYGGRGPKLLFGKTVWTKPGNSSWTFWEPGTENYKKSNLPRKVSCPLTTKPEKDFTLKESFLAKSKQNQTYLTGFKGFE